MALKVELKPGERIILGESIITNDGHRTRLSIEGEAPILREKDILRPEEADSPCERVYAVIEMMYLSREPAAYHPLYFGLVRDIQGAAPSTMPLFENINSQILQGAYYKALKAAQKLIAYEKELIENAQCS